jgi:DNA-binding transcriptional ArsR family regulator
MKDGPNIVGISALIGDHARAEVLTTLMSGQALTATELAEVAGLTKQTMSSHLAKLVDAGLVTVSSQGRHRYFRIAGSDVALLLETLMGVAFMTGAIRLRSSPREPALRKARVCYDHLAGELGVMVYDGLIRRQALKAGINGLELTEAGKQLFAELGIRPDAANVSRRALCRSCMDWSERRDHLAGSLGATLLQRIVELGWAKRVAGTRVLAFSDAGERALRKMFELHDRPAVNTPAIAEAHDRYATLDVSCEP